MAKNQGIKILRQLAQELRHLTPNKPVTTTDAMRYVMAEARTHDMTDERVCRPSNEMQLIALTYFTYLNSNRMYKSLYEHGITVKSGQWPTPPRWSGLVFPIISELD